jgi:hypothetical protein
MTRSEPPVHIPFPSTQNINWLVMDTSAVMDHRAAPSLSAEDKRWIERVARCVARDRDGDLTEKLLLRLLDITRNTRRGAESSVRGLPPPPQISDPSSSPRQATSFVASLLTCPCCQTNASRF